MIQGGICFSCSTHGDHISESEDVRWFGVSGFCTCRDKGKMNRVQVHSEGKSDSESRMAQPSEVEDKGKKAVVKREPLRSPRSASSKATEPSLPGERHSDCGMFKKRIRSKGSRSSPTGSCQSSSSPSCCSSRRSFLGWTPCARKPCHPGS